MALYHNNARLFHLTCRAIVCIAVSDRKTAENMYGKPPNNTKFKPGQSGNPAGRPRRLNESDMVEIIHKIMKLYAAAKSNDKAIRHPAHQTILKMKDILYNSTNLDN